MNRSADKVLAAFACAILLGAIGAFSWHGGQEASLPVRGLYESESGFDSCDEVVEELERIQTFWRNNDAGKSYRKGAAGNP